MACGLGLGRAEVSDSKNPTLPSVQGSGYQSQAFVCLVCNVLEISLVQRYLISFLLTLSQCMIAADSVPCLPWKQHIRCRTT